MASPKKITKCRRKMRDEAKAKRRQRKVAAKTQKDNQNLALQL